MEINAATQAFATLGHTARLSVFRLLVRMAPQPMRPTEMAGVLDLKPNTLSHYLSDLEAAGLIRSERQGRSLLYAVDPAQIAALVDYLIHDCCRSRPDLCFPQSRPATVPAMAHQTFNVLFVCSGNAARSIIAEALLRDLGAGRFRAYSAGTRPGDGPHPDALRVLVRNGHDTTDLRSKHLSRFQGPEGPVMDFVFTLCDSAAAEECPPWPAQPISGHWGLPDPVKASGTEAEKALAFQQTYAALRRRIAAFAALPFEQLDRIALQARVDAIALDQG